MKKWDVRNMSEKRQNKVLAILLKGQCAPKRPAFKGEQ